MFFAPLVPAANEFHSGTTRRAAQLPALFVLDYLKISH
jgi:hypothetical protein